MTTVTGEPTPAVSAVSPELEAFIEGERRRADVTGTAVAAFDRDGMRFAGGFGFADRERGERATPETLFRAASISKLFTTTLVLREVESGRIALDAPMNQYLDPRVRIRNKHGGTADEPGGGSWAPRARQRPPALRSWGSAGDRCAPTAGPA